MSQLVSCLDVSKAYGTDVIIKDLNLTLAQSESLAAIGPSGCGKTTLLKIIGLIDKPTSGKVLIKKHDTSLMSEADLAELRRYHIGYSFQEPTFIHTLNVLENVLLPFYPWKTWSQIKICKEKAIDVLSSLGLSGLEKRKPTDLSTGQRKRVDLARAIVKESEILIVDEPTTNLDKGSSKLIVETLKRQMEEGRALIFSVTTDQKLLKLAHKRVNLRRN